MRAVNDTLFTLVLEDALKSDNPKNYYKSLGHSPISVEKLLFPRNDVTIGERELKKILNWFDTNRDQQVSRQEIRDKFMQHRAAVARPYEQELKRVLRKIDLLTYRP